MSITCQTCGTLYENDNPRYVYPAYHFSSTTYAKGSFTTPGLIEAAAEQMLTCPLDEGEAPDEYPTGSTPSGGSMYEGSDRFTAGDETDPDRDNLPPLREADDTL